jgi:hypothetical protein
MKLAVTNTSSHALEDVQVDLRTRTSRVTDRATIAQWQQESEPDLATEPVASSTDRSSLAAGATATFTVTVAADDLDFSSADYLWGTRRLSLTVASGDDALGSLRTFTVWRPDGADQSVAQSVLLPVSGEEPGLASLDPEAHAASVTSGQLHSTAELARRGDVDWLLDPSLLDPPVSAPSTDDATAQASDGGKDEATGGTGIEGPPTEASETAEAGDTGDATDAPSATPIPEPDPAAASLAETLGETAGTGDRDVLALPYMQADQPSLEVTQVPRLSDDLSTQADAAWSSSGITPLAQVEEIPAQEVSGEILDARTAAGADLLLTSSSSLREDPAGTVTPSSVGIYTDGHREVTVLAPDPELSSLFSSQTSGADSEAIRQRLLAETATIASEQVSAGRQILIVPTVTGDTDVDAASATLDAFADAPWIEGAHTSDLLDAVEEGRTGTNTRADGDELYTLGTLDQQSVYPSADDGTGVWVHADTAIDRPRVAPATLRTAQHTLGDLDNRAVALEDPAVLSSTRQLALSTASARFLDTPEVATEHGEIASEQTDALGDSVQVVPVSGGYTLVADSAGVPLTIQNDLDTAVTVQVVVRPDGPAVQTGKPTTVTVPARGTEDVTVPVTAVASGRVNLSVELRTTDDQPFSPAMTVPLNANPAWESWTTGILAAAMAVLIVVGVLRARRTGSASRAPAVRAELHDEDEA